jgi:hypothetical protein
MTDWHVDGATWQAYAAGRLDPAAEAAVDAHVTACVSCRSGARDLLPDPEPLWQAVHDEIARHRLRWWFRWLRRMGVPDDDVAVMAAADDLLLPWAVAVGGALVSVIAAGNLGRHDDLAFLLLAPLVPVLAVVAAFDATDPMRELAITTSYSKVRLALLRTVATLAVALPVTVVASVVVPVLRPLAWVWLLPSLGLTSAALVLLTWTSTRTCAVIVASSWTGVVAVVTGAGRLDAVGTLPGQVTFAVVTAALSLAFVRISTPRVSTSNVGRITS